MPRFVFNHACMDCKVKAILLIATLQ